MVSHCREPRAGEHGLQWSVGSGLIGFEKDNDSLGETQPRTCLVFCDAVPLCVAIDRLRPCAPAEWLAFSMNANQQSFTSCSRLRHNEASLMNALHCAFRQLLTHREIGEDERDDEMSEPTGKRKETHTDECAKELRASLPASASSHASSLRPGHETQEQLVRSAKHARTTKKAVETLQDVSFLIQKGHCERQRNGWISSSEDGWCASKSNKKKLLKKKDGERNLYFPSCPPKIQAALRETRHAEWKQWMSFNAFVTLTDEGVRQHTEGGCEIYTMQWIEVDKSAHLRRDNEFVSFLAKYKSRLVGCGNLETTEGLHTHRLSSW